MIRALVAAVVAGALLAVHAPALADSRRIADPRSLWAATAHDEDLTISLVTFGPGDEVHQYFGHNALLVEDRERDVGALYNFGMFSFGPDMLPKYLQGQLEFWAAATAVQPTYHMYVEQNRSIQVRELNLSPAKRRALAERLSYYVQPEHRSYLYHHYENNCSTKVRDMIDSAVDGQFMRANSGRGALDYRDETRRYTQQDPFIHMLLLLWMNDSMERPIRRYDEAFLPDELEKLVDQASYTDENGKTVPLVRLRYTVFAAHRAPVPAVPSRGWPELLAVGLLCAGIALGLSRWLRRTGSRVARALLGLHHMLLGLVIGVPGLVLFLFMFTKWDVTHGNENLFIANPLTFLAFPLGFWMMLGSQRAQRWIGYVWLALGATTALAIVLKLLPMFDQDTHLPLALIAPINLGCALAHLGLVKQPRAAVERVASDAASRA